MDSNLLDSVLTWTRTSWTWLGLEPLVLGLDLDSSLLDSVLTWTRTSWTWLGLEPLGLDLDSNLLYSVLTWTRTSWTWLGFESLELGLDSDSIVLVLDSTNVDLTTALLQSKHCLEKFIFLLVFRDRPYRTEKPNAVWRSALTRQESMKRTFFFRTAETNTGRCRM